MKVLFKNLLFFLFIGYSSLASAQQCVSPREPICVFAAPKSIYIGVQITFEDKESDQIVYLDGGCGMGVYKFFSSAKNNIMDKRVASETSLKFILCRNGKFINDQNVDVKSDSKILCRVSKEMKCSIKQDAN